MVTLSSRAAVLDAIGLARHVEIGAYLIPPAVRDALAAAARRGARVEVTLPRRIDEGDARGMNAANAAAARRLRAAGAHVAWSGDPGKPFHLKAAVCDGTAFLSDRNWAGRGGYVVRDRSPADVALVRRALRGAGGNDGALATRKDVALRREAALIDAAGPRTPVVVATESFARGPVADALRHRAARGGATLLLIARGEVHAGARRTVRALAQAGVAVRYTAAGEKFALAGPTAWIGSANATGAGGADGDQVEWGMITGSARVVGALRQFAAGG